MLMFVKQKHECALMVVNKTDKAGQGGRLCKNICFTCVAKISARLQTANIAFRAGMVYTGKQE